MPRDPGDRAAKKKQEVCEMSAIMKEGASTMLGYG